MTIEFRNRDAPKNPGRWYTFTYDNGLRVTFAEYQGTLSEIEELGRQLSREKKREIRMRVHDMELRLEGTRPRDPEKVYRDLPAFVRRYLDYSVDDGGVMHMVRKDNAFTFADNRSGMSVMLTSADTTFDEMMTSYDVRDRVEKAFDVYRNDSDGGRSRTGNVERARGRLFLKFIALMLRIRIQNILRMHDEDAKKGTVKKDTVCGMTVNEVLLSLNTVFAIGNTGDWRLTAVSKNVREIFRLFGLEEPKSGKIVLA